MTPFPITGGDHQVMVVTNIQEAGCWCEYLDGAITLECKLSAWRLLFLIL